jgi:nicotinamidase-related amidase
MQFLTKRPTRVLLVCALAALASNLAAKDFVKPEAHPAKTYPARDDHSTEKVAIAADPYDSPAKAKIFTINFQDHGLLPIFFIVTNDGDQPISIANMQVTLITAGRAKLTPIAPEDIFRRLSNPHANTHPLPLPIPQKKVKGTLSQKERDEIETSQFAARAVEPRTTQSGFFFFDVEDINTPLEGAHLYITGVNDAKGSELMYFEIQMEK